MSQSVPMIRPVRPSSLGSNENTMKSNVRPGACTRYSASPLARSSMSNRTISIRQRSRLIRLTSARLAESRVGGSVASRSGRMNASGSGPSVGSVSGAAVCMSLLYG